MVIFDNLYEVYHRGNKSIVAQGTYDECVRYSTRYYFYSTRLAAVRYYSRQEVIDLVKNLLKEFK